MGHSIGAIKNNLADFSAQHTWSDSEEVILDLMKDKKVLYMPLHSWEGDVVNQINNDVSLLKFLNPRRVTVLMGFLDFVDFESRHFFESMGFTTECAGIRASKIFGSPAGGRETFLYTLFKIISEHDYVVANGLTTGLLYAACLKKNVGILPALQSPRIKYSSWRNQDEFAADIDRQRAFFPWLISTSSTDKSKIQNDLYEALGVEKCKTQSQLFDCLPLMLKE
jgi:hypothetical protein